MAKEIVLRKGNSGGVITMTIPRQIADMYGMRIGTKIELIPFTTDIIQMRVMK